MFSVKRFILHYNSTIYTTTTTIIQLQCFDGNLTKSVHNIFVLDVKRKM